MSYKRWIVAICFAAGALFSGALNAQVTWDTPGSGNWEDGVNWSTGLVPQSGEDVVIDQGGGLLISIGGSIPNVNSIFSNENILLSGGDLVLANGGTINGSLTLGTNLDLSSNGGVFTASGSTVLDGGNVFADSAVINLSTVSSYLTDTGSNSSRAIRGRNGSTINLSGLADVTGGGFIRTLSFQAESGSSINLSNLSNHLGGSTRFEATGPGSSIDMSSLATLADTNAQSGGWIQATDGGAINASALTSISSNAGAGIRFIVDGAGSSINANLASALNTRVQLLNGGTHDFSAITSFNGSEASVDSGSTIDLTGVITYDTNGGGNQSRAFTATGAGSSVDLSNVTTAVGGSFIRRLNVEALAGGNVDLSSLAVVASGAVAFTADGANSLVDVSSLQTINDNNGNVTSFLSAVNGGEIRLDTNAATNLTFDGVNISIDGTGVIDTSRIVNYRNGTFTADGANQTLDLADGSTSSFIANAGANLDISSLTGTVENGGANFATMNLEANGGGSMLNASGITQLSFDATSINPNINLTAKAGGQVDASNVQTLLGNGGIVNSNRAITVTADGVGSSVNLSSLTTFSDTASFTESALIATDGGAIDLGTGTVQLTNVNLIVDTGGTIMGGTLDLNSMNINSSGDPDDFSTLSGNGVITADIINTSGVIAAGNSPGTLTIDGDFTQLTEGLMQFEIDTLSLFDVVEVTADAMFGGDLEVILDAAFDLQDGDSFQIISVDGTSGGQFNGLAQNSVVLSDNGFDLRIDYFGGDGNDVRLFANSVPEPGSLGLLAAFGFVGLARRRRR